MKPRLAILVAPVGVTAFVTSAASSTGAVEAGEVFGHPQNQELLNSKSGNGGHQMADIECEKFKLRSWVLNTPMLTWSATLNANPSAGWKRAFDEALAIQAAVGGSTGAPLRTLPFQGHTILEFDSPENTAEATVNQIHRAIEKANKVAAEQQAELKKQADVEKKKHDEAQAELERLKSKYKDGI